MAKAGLSSRGEMIKLREQGYTYQKIADIYGVSRQCIWQLINREEYMKQQQTPQYKAYKKKYYQENKEKINKRFREWIQRHPNYMRAYYQTHKKNKNTIDK